MNIITGFGRKKKDRTKLNTACWSGLISLFAQVVAMKSLANGISDAFRALLQAQLTTIVIGGLFLINTGWRGSLISDFGVLSWFVKPNTNITDGKPVLRSNKTPSVSRPRR